MQAVDYIVVVIYLLGMLVISTLFSKRMKNANDMFSAGGQSPWWISGLSAFMTMFSAGTFVVWGGIAYQYGLVAIAINCCYGIAALLVGRYIAGQWKEAGVNSASEFLQLRFGSSIVQFYTWFKGLLTIFTTGGSIYALSKIVSALIPLSYGHWLADPATGHLSVAIMSTVLCIVVVLIAFSGGLWAVLMTDVLQFIVLTVSVLLVVPLILGELSSVDSFVNQMPEGYFSLTTLDFPVWFLVGWLVLNFVTLGGDWAFIQRYLCVPDSKSAKKSAYLIGVMYIVSPIIWMIPPLAFRAIEPNIDAEQAYILACQYVLPAGLMGLMMAAMLSATASMATTRLNVFAGAFTEIYCRYKNYCVNHDTQIWVGRLATVVLGAILLLGALLIPRYGYTKFILDINTLLYVPLVLPTLWGLFSKRIGLLAVWLTMIFGFIASFILKFGLSQQGFLSSFEIFTPYIEWISLNTRTADVFVGVLFPFITLLIIEKLSNKEHEGWQRFISHKESVHLQDGKKVAMTYIDTLPLTLSATTMFIIAIGLVISAFYRTDIVVILIVFALVLSLLSIYILRYVDRQKKQTFELSGVQ